MQPRGGGGSSTISRLTYAEQFRSLLHAPASQNEKKTVEQSQEMGEALKDSVMVNDWPEYLIPTQGQAETGCCSNGGAKMNCDEVLPTQDASRDSRRHWYSPKKN